MVDGMEEMENIDMGGGMEELNERLERLPYYLTDMNGDDGDYEFESADEDKANYDRLPVSEKLVLMKKRKNMYKNRYLRVWHRLKSLEHFFGQVAMSHIQVSRALRKVLRQ